MNGSVSSNKWSNAAGGTETSNNLKTKVYISPNTESTNNPSCAIGSLCNPRSASREDTFVLDGTVNPGEYCIIYKFKSSGGNVASGTPSTGFSDQPYYPTGGVFSSGDITIATEDLNFTSGGALRYAPTTNPARFVVNPSIASPPGPYSVGYVDQSQDAANAPYPNIVYNTDGTFPSASLDIILNSAQVTANPVSPYLNISATGIPAGTYIAAINVGGNPNKITLSQASTGVINSTVPITIGRPTLTAPFINPTNGILLYSTSNRVNTVSQLFTDAACTLPYGVSSGDGSSNLFKLFNQNFNAANPGMVTYQTTSDVNLTNSPFMGFVTDRPLASAKIDGNGYITTSGTTLGDRGVSPISQEVSS